MSENPTRCKPTMEDLVGFVRTLVEAVLGHDSYKLLRASASSNVLIEIVARNDRDYSVLTGRSGANVAAMRTLIKQYSINGDLPRVQFEIARSNHAQKEVG